MTIQPTPQQEATYAAVKNTGDHIALAAVAGAGKSSTIVEASKYAKGRAGFVAFNKAIVEELTKKLPRTVEARTMHSMGLRILKRKWKDCEVDFDRRKDWELLESEAPELFGKPYRPGGRPKASADAMIVLDVMDRIKNSMMFEYTPDEVINEAWELFQNAEIPEERLAALAIDFATRSINDMTSITGADMVSGPVYHDMVFPHFDTLFCDESQDWSKAQRLLGINSGDRIIFVGDRRQAIMGFAGADSRSFDSIIADLAEDPVGTRELPLSVCFRCPASHAKLAALIEPTFTSPEWAREGLIDECGLMELSDKARDGALVICRTNAPLVGGAFAMIRKGRKALVRGRAIGQGLLQLVNKWKTDSSSLLMQRMDGWMARETAKIEKRPGDHKAALLNLQDRYDCIKFFADQEPTVTGMKTKIESLFADITPENSVVFSSIHRSKGLEASQVFWMDAGKLAGAVGQEANLAYVALTRSKSELWMTGSAAPLAARDLPDFAAGIGGRGPQLFFNPKL